MDSEFQNYSSFPCSTETDLFAEVKAALVLFLVDVEIR